MSSTLLDQPLADLLRDMQQELESHMLKEEQILFPMLLGGYARQASAPIAMMRFEHDHHGQALRQMETLTHAGPPPPPHAPTHRPAPPAARRQRPPPPPRARREGKPAPPARPPPRGAPPSAGGGSWGGG